MKIKFRRGANRFQRFGGGWHWKLGIASCKGFRTIILDVLVGSIRIDR